MLTGRSFYRTTRRPKRVSNPCSRALPCAKVAYYVESFREEPMHIAAINRYPVKSLRGHALEETVVRRYGIEHDRQYMLVMEDTGKMLTQRECPKLALLAPRIEDGHLIVTVPGSADILVPRAPDTWTDQQLTVDLWDHQYVGAVANEMINVAFGEAIGVRCRLLAARSDVFRTQTEVGFHDDAPILVIGRASLDDLNSRLESPLPMNRFRPTLEIEGSAPFDEDNWQRITIGGSTYRPVKLCVRCSITTVDQAIGEFRGPEPLKTLATFRRKGQNVAFGAYFRPENPGSTIRVGDELRI